MIAEYGFRIAERISVSAFHNPKPEIKETYAVLKNYPIAAAGKITSDL